jgi:hypothetical protein
MPSIVMIPTSERLVIERSEDILGGVKMGIQLRPGVAVSVHLARAQALEIAAAIKALCPRPPRKRAR